MHLDPIVVPNIHFVVLCIIYSSANWRGNIGHHTRGPEAVVLQIPAEKPNIAAHIFQHTFYRGVYRFHLNLTIGRNRCIQIRRSSDGALAVAYRCHHTIRVHCRHRFIRRDPSDSPVTDGPWQNGSA